MPTLPHNPHNDTCPDYTAPVFQPARDQLTASNTNLSEALAAETLQNLWEATNIANKSLWDREIEDETAAAAVAAAAEAQEAREAEELELVKAREDADATLREDMKKNRAKYLTIRDRMVPTVLPMPASKSVVKKLANCQYFYLWHFTNAGLTDAAKTASSTKANRLTM
ncbi:hypothetical protein CPB83DRAFT_740913, partial [Crepidotus variabilis]